MRHARDDYNRIQDPTGLIPEDEPVFLLRGKDRAAPTAIRAWAEEAAEIGADMRIVSAALDQADAMDQWQVDHGGQVPDMPEEAPPVRSLLTLADPTGTLLREIATPELKRKDVATTYALALHAANAGVETDWSKVNRMIIERWSLSALTWIKERAWKIAESGPEVASA